MTHESTQKTVSLSGARSIREAAETYGEMGAAVRGPGDIILDCAGVTQADMSFIQIILAGHRSARASGKLLVLSAAPDGALLSALQRGGFAQHGSTNPGTWVSSEGSA